MANMTQLLARYLIGQIDAGVDAVQIFDSWAGAIGPRDYATHVLPHTLALVEAVRAHVPEGREPVPVILFARGNANILALTATVPADVIGIGLEHRARRGDRGGRRDRVVQGNLDPGVLLGPPELIRTRVRETLAAGQLAKAHVFNLATGISRTTDPAHAKLMVDTVHAGVGEPG